MGEIFRFVTDLRLKMYNYDTQKHKEPHFHVYIKNQSIAVISVATGELLEGKLSSKDKRLIKNWIIKHKEELWDRWNKAVSGEYIEKIKGDE